MPGQEMSPKMHSGEVDTDAALVARLLAAQFPEWARHTIEQVLADAELS